MQTIQVRDSEVVLVLTKTEVRALDRKLDQHSLEKWSIAAQNAAEKVQIAVESLD